MANKKYEMMFAMNAQLNGGFSGTFSKAQAEFSRLGKEIQSLHRVQGDITSYQKQQGAIENTKGKLKNLEQQHDLLQKEIKETTGSTTQLDRENLKLEQRIKDTRTALERQEQKLSDTSSRLKDVGVDTSNLAQKDAELAVKLKELQAEQDKAAEGAQGMGEKTAQAFGAVQQAIAAAGIAVALKEIADALMECVGIAGNFEEAMSTVEALSQSNSREMAALSEQAKELGATTKFTAQQAGDAMGYMAMAGWDANEMLAGMDGVLQLAAASGEDLAMVSDIVTDSLSAFGLTAADTAHFSDVLAAAATNSNTNVSIMGETFKMSASVAGALGYSIEDVAVAMGLMANSGVKGSIAGTALRNTFNGLLEGVTLTGAAFRKYEYSAVKADGTMKDFGATIDELRGCFEQMTEAERVSNAMTIAGKRGYNGLLAILNATEEDYTSLTSSINDCSGAAERMAKIKLDNLNGQLVLMQSAWDALKTTIGEQFIPVARGVYALGTDIFTGLNEFVKANPAVVKAVAAGVAVLGTATTALMAYAAIRKVVNALNLVPLIAGAGPIIAAVTGVAALTGAIVGMVETVNAGIPSVKELTEATRDMRQSMDEANAAYEQTASKTLATASVAGTYIDKLEEIEAATNGQVEGNQEYHNILTLLTRAVPELADKIDLETNSIEGGTEALWDNTLAWEENAKAQAYQEYMNSLMDDYNAVMVEAAENELKLTEAKIKAESASEGMRITYQKLLNTLGMTDVQFRRAYGSVRDIPYRAVSDDVAALRDEYLDYDNQLSQAEKTQRNLRVAIADNSAAVAEAETVLNGAQTAYERLTGVTEEQTAAEAEAAQRTAELQGVIGTAIDEVDRLADSYTDAYNAAYDSISGQFGLFEKLSVEVDTSVADMIAALESQVSYMDSYAENLMAAATMGLSDGLLAQLSDGSKESAAYLQAIVEDGGKKIAALNAAFGKVEEGKELFSDTVAELQEDFAAATDAVQQKLADNIEAMDLGPEAAQSAYNTFKAYIDQAGEMLPEVRDVCARMGRVILNALNVPEHPSLSVSVQNTRERVTGAFASGRVTGAYASGTQNAEPGLALVGEKGPELVYFHGGEQVLTAAETEAVMMGREIQNTSAMLRPDAAAYAQRASFEPVEAMPMETVINKGTAPAPVSIQVNFQIEGNATTEIVEQLRTYGNEFAERVLEVLEEYGVDKARGAYA